MNLSAKFDAKEIESQVRAHIKTFDLEKEIFKSDKQGRIRFIEGPPTMKDGISSCRPPSWKSNQRPMVQIQHPKRKQNRIQWRVGRPRITSRVAS